MIHVYMAAANGGGGGDIFTIAHGLLTRLLGLGGLALVLFVGAKALGHVANDKFGLAVGIVLIALIPAFFLLDPTGATNSLTNAVHSIGG